MAENPKILLHICCAPDSTAVFERLAPDFDVTGFFHNPNIHPRSEYLKRLSNAETAARSLGFPLIVAEYDPEGWGRRVQGLEGEPERGKRCEVCFRMNLRATARKAQGLGFPFFTTTLSLSPHKDFQRILEIGRDAADEFGVPFIGANFKKQDGFRRSLEISRELDLYRQNYCGCRYSIPKEGNAGASGS
jgi:predicted adenine nucleotide alpha hydrolase (AANH) superfamily ATPase